MIKNIIKSIIIENQEFISSLDIKERDISIEEQANYIFTGQRRAGKTYFIYHLIQERFIKTKRVEDFLYINFEDERLMEFKYSDLSLIIEAHRELYENKPVVFLDEIQVVEGWQKFARRLADQNYRVFITGSNAKMLSTEMATTLGGRFWVKEIQNLSFKEFLRFNDIIPEPNFRFSDQRFLIKKLFEEYFYFGGFPEILRYKEKKEYLSNLFQKVFLGDIVARNQVRNVQALKLLLKKLAESIMDETSLTRIKNIISSIGVKTGTATLIEYISFLEDAFLIKSFSNYKAKITERESKKKYYYCDNGILNLFLINPESSLMENLVFNDLASLYTDNFYYYRDNTEVDFYVPGKMLLQVAFSIKDNDTRKREVNALIKAASELNEKRLFIISFDEEEEIFDSGYTIKVIPLWLWLLGVR